MSTCKILAVGDMHFKASNAIQTFAVAAQIIEAIKTHKPDAVVVLGDILDRHDRVDLYPLHRAIAFLSDIHTALLSIIDDDDEEKNIKIRRRRQLWVLIGNHDRPNNTTFLTDEHPFTSLKKWSNTFVADVPLTVSVSDMNFLLMPYVYPGRFEEALTISRCGGGTTNPSLLLPLVVFAHQEFRGAKYGGGGSIFSKNGDVYPLDAPLCISGHIHERSSPQKNVLYIGTPFDLERGGKEIALISVSSTTTTSTDVTSSTISPPPTKGSSLSSVSTNIKFVRLVNIPVNHVLTFDSPAAFLRAIEEENKKDDGCVSSLTPKIKIICENMNEFTSLVKENPDVRKAIASSGSVLFPRFSRTPSSLPATSVMGNLKTSSCFLDVLSTTALAAAAAAVSSDATTTPSSRVVVKPDTSIFFKDCFPSHEFVIAAAAGGSGRKKYIIKRKKI